MTASKKGTQTHDAVPNFASYDEERAVWDSHDFTDFVDEWKRSDSPQATTVVYLVSVEIDIQTLSDLVELGKKRGVEPLTLCVGHW